MVTLAGAPARQGTGVQCSSSTIHPARRSWSLPAASALIGFTTTAPAPSAARTPAASMRCSAAAAMIGVFQRDRADAVASLSLIRGAKR
jgi:hypothetical protein